MKYLLVFSFLVFYNASFAQNGLIDIRFPKKWVPFGNEAVLQQVKKGLNIKDSIKAQIVENNKSSIISMDMPRLKRALHTDQISKSYLEKIMQKILVNFSKELNQALQTLQLKYQILKLLTY